jgi:hypothetical protein
MAEGDTIEWTNFKLSPLEVCDRLKGEDSSVTGSRKGVSFRNPHAVVSFVLGVLTGLYGILTGSSYYYAGWPAHGPVGVLGLFLMIFGLVTILGSFLVLLTRRVRIVGAVLILVFGLIGNMQGTFNITGLIAKLLLPILSFIFALYAIKSDRQAIKSDRQAIKSAAAAA